MRGLSKAQIAEARKKLDDGYRARICEICKVGIFFMHEDSKLSHDGWVKCNLCRFTKKVDREEIRNKQS